MELTIGLFAGLGFLAWRVDRLLVDFKRTHAQPLEPGPFRDSLIGFDTPAELS